MNEDNIRDRIVDHGQTILQAPKQLIPFTKAPKADTLLNDLEAHPHAFALACVMDRQIKAEIFLIGKPSIFPILFDKIIE